MNLEILMGKISETHKETKNLSSDVNNVLYSNDPKLLYQQAMSLGVCDAYTLYRLIEKCFNAMNKIAENIGVETDLYASGIQTADAMLNKIAERGGNDVRVS